MGSALFTPLAVNDLKEIKSFIALDNPKAASLFVTLLKQKRELLADSPTLGIQRSEYYKLYKFPVHDYLIFYRISKTGIDVIRILHGSRDIEAIFNSKK